MLSTLRVVGCNMLKPFCLLFSASSTTQHHVQDGYVLVYSGFQYIKTVPNQRTVQLAQQKLECEENKLQTYTKRR